MGVNSIRAEKLSAIVSRILNKKEAFISGRFLRLCSSSLTVSFDNIHFSPIFFKGKKYENCSNVLWRLRGTKLKCNLIKSDFQRVREVFLFSFFLFSVKYCCVALCKKDKRTTRIKCEKVSNLTWVFLSKNSSWGLEGLCDRWVRELCMCACHQSQCGLYQRMNQIAC